MRGAYPRRRGRAKRVSAGATAAFAAAVLTLFVLFPISSHADHINCHDLSKCCSDPKGSPDYGLCVGYIVGVADVMSQGVPVSGFRSCLTDEVPVTELRQVVLDFLASEHGHTPVDRHPAAGTIAEAFARAWPC